MKKDIGKMRIGIIGRSELLYSVALKLIDLGYSIPLIITAKEAPEYRVTSKDFQILAKKINASFIHSAKINSEEVVKGIQKALPLDLGVSINYSGIISQSIIDFFKIGVLNAHGGDLPKYRGNACQAWALIQGEDRVGLCVHKMIGGELDSGEIIEKGYFDANINTRIGEVYSWMEEKIPLFMISAIEKLQTDSQFFLEKQSKDPAAALRCYPRKPEDGKIVWTSSAGQILRLINASSEPFSGAYCFFDGNKITIWRAELHKDCENYLAVPGQVTEILQNGEIICACGNGKIKITEIQIENDRIKPATIIKSIRNRFS